MQFERLLEAMMGRTAIAGVCAPLHPQRWLPTFSDNITEDPNVFLQRCEWIFAESRVEQTEWSSLGENQLWGNAAAPAGLPTNTSTHHGSNSVTDYDENMIERWFYRELLSNSMLVSKVLRKLVKFSSWEKICCTITFFPEIRKYRVLFCHSSLTN